MIKKLFAVIEKDVRQLVHSKSSALIILISPIILMILAGLALSSSGLSGVKIGVYADKSLSESSGTDTILPVLDAKMAERGFSVQYFSTIDTCKQAVKDETTHICVEVTEKEDKNLANIDKRLIYRVNFYVDYSKVRLVWAIVNAIRTIVAEENAKISMEITAKVSQKVDFAVNEITKNKGKIDSLIAEGNALKAGISNGKADARQIDSYIDSLTATTREIDQAADTITFNINGINSYLALMTERINSLSSIPGTATIVNGMRTDVTNINGFVASLASLPSDIKEKTSRITGQINSIRTASRTLQDSFSPLEISITEIITSLQDVKSGIEEVEREFSWVRNINTNDITNPIPVEVLPLSGEVTEVGSVSSALTYLDYLLPALVILVIMFVSTLISSTMVIKERKSVAYFRNLIAPTNNSLYMFGVYLIGMILVGMQAALLVLVASVFFGVSISSYASIAIVLLLTISIFVLLGIIIGYLFSSEETTMMGAISLALVCLLFSALIIPLETMPTLMRAIAQFSPFVIAETALRKIMIFNIPIINYSARRLMWEPVKLAVITVVLFAVALVTQKFKNRKEI